MKRDRFHTLPTRRERQLGLQHEKLIPKGSYEYRVIDAETLAVCVEATELSMHASTALEDMLTLMGLATATQALKSVE